MTTFLEALRDGRAAPEEVEGVLRELMLDPRLELLFLLSESERYVDARGVPARGLADDTRRRIPIERGGQPLGMVLLDPPGRNSVTCCAVSSRPAGSRSRSPDCASSYAASSPRSRPRARGSSRPATTSVAESSAISTTAPSSGSSRSGSRYATPSTSSGRRRRSVPAETLDGAVAEVAVAIEELRELARGLPPSQLDGGLAPAFHELARRAPVPVEVDAPRERFGRDVEAAAYFIGCEGLTNAVKHAHATKILLSARRRDRQLVVSIADDGIGGAMVGQGSGLRGLSDRIAALGGTLRIESARGAGTTLTAELPCAS